ncbi:hypothetical protein MF672_041960 [Actinomadura sp. ATCC 31491]|uniref:Translation initiation factor IF-2 n=1 Tax=Actinomadura luzonensis TaxID=2805427 RepID=A0ABT0G7F7_9ACTN|nr:hypothetical protein [Actinomadura luzonensis]MCK2220323.1 hypothetical protein [Actinomadura luzonensis]
MRQVAGLAALVLSVLAGASWSGIGTSGVTASVTSLERRPGAATPATPTTPATPPTTPATPPAEQPGKPLEQPATPPGQPGTPADEPAASLKVRSVAVSRTASRSERANESPRHTAQDRPRDGRAGEPFTVPPGQARKTFTTDLGAPRRGNAVPPGRGHGKGRR